MSIPKPAVFSWATDPGAVVQAPSSGLAALGYISGQMPTAGNWNHIWRVFANWTAYLNQELPVVIPLASTGTAGLTRLSVSPADAAVPISAGTNDPRLASAGLNGVGSSEAGLRIQRGSVLSSYGGETSGGTVSFPVAFASAPTVTCAVESGSPRMVTMTAPSASGVTFQTADADGNPANATVHWIAIGP